MKLFALGGTEIFGNAVASRLAVGLSPIEERNFEDGEHKLRPLVSVSGDTVFVIQSLYSDETSSVDDKICKLLFFTSTLKDSGASQVIVIVPYLAYGRKDRRTKPGDPVTGKYLAQLFEAAGANAIIACDVHNLQAFENAFRIPAINVEAARIMIGEVKELDHNAVPVIVSPDFGGIKRAERFAELCARLLNRQLSVAVAEKYRSEDVLSGSQLFGDVRGKHVVIIDDIIATGATVGRAAVACKREGAASIKVVATHGALTSKADEHLNIPEIHQIILTNTISDKKWKHLNCSHKIRMIDASPLFSEVVVALTTNNFTPGPQSASY